MAKLGGSARERCTKKIWQQACQNQVVSERHFCDVWGVKRLHAYDYKWTRNHRILMNSTECKLSNTIFMCLQLSACSVPRTQLFRKIIWITLEGTGIKLRIKIIPRSKEIYKLYERFSNCKVESRRSEQRIQISYFEFDTGTPYFLTLHVTINRKILGTAIFSNTYDKQKLLLHYNLLNISDKKRNSHNCWINFFRC